MGEPMKLRMMTAALGMVVAVGALGACSSSTNTAKNAGPADINHDGKVVVGIISPGDTHDKGYYESFVDEADSYAAQQGWKVVTVDKVQPAGAAEAARNLCRQGVDMVAVG